MPNDVTTAASARAAIRAGTWTSHTSGLADDRVQGNVVILPKALADDFLRYCQRNPKPCPLVEVLDPGVLEPACAPGANIATDLPGYRVYRDGECVAEPADATAHWREDLVAFLIGCSFTFETPLLAAGVPVRHAEAGTTVPMYRTSVDCAPAGRVRGPLVVSMRGIPGHLVSTAVQVTAAYPRMHGAPVHVGDPAGLGILDLDRPDFGDPPVLAPGDVPVFWACGVTPQAAAIAARLPYAVSHAPGMMLVTDVPDVELAGPA